METLRLYRAKRDSLNDTFHESRINFEVLWLFKHETRQVCVMIKLCKSCIFLMLAVVVGCGDSGPQLVPVTGTLSLDGQPLGFKSLTLFPIEGTSGHGAAGFTDGAGSIKLLAVVPGAVRDFEGCPPGRYRVVITEPLIPITDQDSQGAAGGVVADENEPAAAIFIPDSRPKKNKKGGIPSIYTSTTSSPLVIDVADGNEVISLELDSKAT